MSVAGELFRLSSSPLGRWGLPSSEDNPALEHAASQHAGGPCSSTRISRQIPSTRGRQDLPPLQLQLAEQTPHRTSAQRSNLHQKSPYRTYESSAYSSLACHPANHHPKTTESSSHQTSLSLGTREWLGSGTRAHHRLQEAITALDVAMIGATETGAAAATTVAITVAASGPGVLAP
jgi:hypothetical protein